MAKHCPGRLVMCQLLSGGARVETLVVPSEYVYVTKGLGSEDEFNLNRPVCNNMMKGGCVWGEKCIFVHVDDIGKYVARETVEGLGVQPAVEHTLAKGQIVAGFTKMPTGAAELPGTYLYKSEDVLVTAGVRNGKGTLCKWYHSIHKCKYNEKCRYIHVAPTAAPLEYLPGTVATQKPTVTYRHLLTRVPIP
eukprot:TRINITY_DN20557_c0_g1_i1.p1 TRINITY_DN20557_c0_g1~~TRINITY_DN20557_c0_g1_i1.p1  ORF type:complete len:192 (+),score=65.82 TRINITY_DN20557_c0_g1_i1:58-633(+)